MSCGTAPGGSCMGNRCRNGGRPDRIQITRSACGILAFCRRTLLGRGCRPSEMRPLSSRESFLMGGLSHPKPLRRPTPQGAPVMTPACAQWSAASPCTPGKPDDRTSAHIGSATGLLKVLAQDSVDRPFSYLCRHGTSFLRHCHHDCPNDYQ